MKTTLSNPKMKKKTKRLMRELSLRDKGDDVRSLQLFLRKVGYLDQDTNKSKKIYTDKVTKTSALNMGVFDEETLKALKTYQKYYRLPVTGKLDVATLTHMRQPRCGYPDHPSKKGLMFFTTTNPWDHLDLTFSFNNFPANLSNTETREAILEAFGLWSSVSPLTFTEVESEGDIKFSFTTGAHGDGNPHDGPGSVLPDGTFANIFAHAYFPPPAGGSLAGEVHFDDSENWSVSLPIPAGAFDLVTAAVHEIGHALGLNHPNPDVPNSIMTPFPLPNGRNLDQDDIDGITSLYGGFSLPGYRDFEGNGYSQVQGGHIEEAKQVATTNAINEAETKALRWIQTVKCPVIRPIKSATMETLESEASAEFVRGPTRGITLGEARVVIRASVSCKINLPHEYDY